MQDRYAGDIGDFGKLGLLRALDSAGFSVGVNWYLTPDETHNEDGRHTAYLKDERYRRCDPALWQTLGHIVDSGQRSVRALEDASLLRAKYFDEPLNFAEIPKADRDTHRQKWHDQALAQLAGCDIIFSDPDNGLMVPSAQETRKSNKFVLPAELAQDYRTGASVIYYQHKARRPDDFYIAQHRQLLQSGMFSQATGFGLKFRSTSQRYYFFLVQPRHAERIAACVQHMLSGGWSQHFSLIE
jgi:hypothetical protein